MTRKEITKFLSDLLVDQRLNKLGCYYASEVTIDYGTENVRRIDFLEFRPDGTMNISDIEKGDFVVYEVKSCKEDFNSGFGTNFIGEKNYIVCSMHCYKEIVNLLGYAIGVICPIPKGKTVHKEFENPTEISKDIEWKLEIVRKAHQSKRKKSMVELLFCMLRSGR